MDEEQQFCLRWNNFQSNITSQFEVLRDEEDFVDVTLACDGQHVKAHKVVLSACSPYFKELFRSNPCKHPILFMRDVEFQHLQSLVEFMYTGEVNVAQAHLTAFLHTAESLQIRGLTEGPQRHKQQQLPPDSSLPSAAKVQRQLQGLSTSVTQKQLTPHHHTNNNKAPSVTSRRNSLSSPEGNNGNDDEVFSLSPPSSPLPAKRQCRGELLESNNLQSSSVSHLLNSQDLIASKPDLESYKDDSLEILEPKLEVPDYNSDSESKTDSAAMASTFLGLDTNSVDINTTMASLHSGMEMPGTSAQNFLGETSQDSAQGRRGLLPHGMTNWASFVRGWSGPLCRNAPLLPTATETSTSKMVPLCDGIEIPETQFNSIRWYDYKKLTRDLASILFTPVELATCSVTGQVWSRARNQSNRPIKPGLNKVKVAAIIRYVVARYPGVRDSKIKQVLAYKCKNCAQTYRAKGAEWFASS